MRFPVFAMLASLAAVLAATPAAAQKPPTDNAAPSREEQVIAEIDRRMVRVDDLFNANRLQEGAAAFGEVVEFAAQELGSNHEMALELLNQQGIMLENFGNYPEAEARFRRVLDASLVSLGESHPRTISVMGDLGRLQHRLANYAEAEQLFLRALALAKEHLGEQSQLTLNAMGNYGGLLRDTGRLREASEMLDEVADRTARVLGEDHELTLQARASYAISLHLAGDSARAEELLAPQLPRLAQIYGPEHPMYLSALNSQATILWQMGRVQEAENVQRRLLELSERAVGPLHQQSLEGLSNYAMILRDLGRQEEARDLLLEAVNRYLSVLGPTHPQTLQAQQNLGMVYQDLGEQGSALLLYEDTLGLLVEAEGPRNPRTLLARNNLATVNLQLDNFDAAIDLLAETYATSREVNGELHPNTLLFLSNLAVAYEGAGRLEEARSAYETTSRLRRQVNGDLHPQTLLASGNHAQFLLGFTDEPYNAFPAAEFAVRGWRQRRDMLADDPRNAAQRERDQAGQARYYELLLDSAYAAAERMPDNAAPYLAAALETMQDLLTGNTSTAIARSAARRMAQEEGNAGRFASERQAFNDEWIAIEGELTEMLADNSAGAEERRAALRDRLASLETSMDALDELLRVSAPEYFAVVRPDALDLAEAQAILGPDEAALMIVPTAMGTHVYAISSDSYHWRRSGLTRRQVENSVRRLQFDLCFASARDMGEESEWLTEGEGQGDFPFAFDEAHLLYQQLIEPFAHVLEGKTHLFVMASGALTSLPLGVLVEAVPEGPSGDPDVLRSAPWLADRYAMVTVPSLQSIRYLREFAVGGDAGGQPFIGFGNPVLEGTATERGARRSRSDGSFARLFGGAGTRAASNVASIEELRRLASLPGTERELQALWQAFGQPDDALYLGRAARESAVKQARLDAEVIVFATHGLLAGQVGGIAEPGLVLTPPAQASAADDGYLSMSEVAELRINADWVILSACNTAGGSSEDSSGLSGLARAFFYAGAENLLVSHWPVFDDVAAELTVRTVELARDNPDLSRAQAFQRAMAEVRDNSDHPDWAHPIAWAPFVLVGDR